MVAVLKDGRWARWMDRADGWTGPMEGREVEGGSWCGEYCTQGVSWVVRLHLDRLMEAFFCGFPRQQRYSTRLIRLAALLMGTPPKKYNSSPGTRGVTVSSAPTVQKIL